jgi:hypothetical protein
MATSQVYTKGILLDVSTTHLKEHGNVADNRSGRMVR